MIFLAPVAASIIKALLIAAGIGGTAAIAGKTLYDSGRRKGQAEGKEACAEEFRAMRDRLDEMEYGG